MNNNYSANTLTALWLPSSIPPFILTSSPSPSGLTASSSCNGRRGSAWLMTKIWEGKQIKKKNHKKLKVWQTTDVFIRCWDNGKSLDSRNRQRRWKWKGLKAASVKTSSMCENHLCAAGNHSCQLLFCVFMFFIYIRHHSRENLVPFTKIWCIHYIKFFCSTVHKSKKEPWGDFCYIFLAYK